MGDASAAVASAAVGTGLQGARPPSEQGSAAEAHLLAGLWTFGIRWLAAAAVLAAIVGVGLYAYAQQLLHGEIVTGLRTIGAGGATWGLYIIFIVFFVGVSFSGISLATVIRLFGVERMRPFARMAELLTIVSLLLGALVVIADLGRPLEGLLNLPKYARPQSPFFWTFSLVVGGYLFSSLVYFFLDGRADAAACSRRAGRLAGLYRLWASGWSGTATERERHGRTTFWLALTILPLLIAAHTTLGLIFGLQGGRPGWFGALQGPGFVILAGASGVGVLIVVSAIVRQALGLERVLPPEGFRWLGNVVMVLSMATLYCMVSEALTSTYASHLDESRIAQEVLAGAYAPLYWTVVACLGSAAAVLFVQFATRIPSIRWSVSAAVLVNAGAVLKRYIIVVPPQTHGLRLPYEAGQYAPTWVELAVIAGLLALGGLMFLVAGKLLPLVPMAEGAEASGAAPEAEPEPRRWPRRAAFGGTLLAGLGLAAAGFLGALRVGTGPTEDPVIPFSAALFVLGIVACFSSAAVYELFPSPRGSPPEEDGEAPGPRPVRAGLSGAAAWGLRT